MRTHSLPCTLFILTLLLNACTLPLPRTADSPCDRAPGLPDAEFTALFQRDGGGWTGGDGVYSVALPDGRVVWTFGDSFLGTVADDGSRTPGTRLIRNAAMLQDGDRFTTLHSSTPDNPSAWITPPDSDEWYWPSAGLVEGDTLILLWTSVRQAEPGMWGFTYAGHDDAAVFSLPDLTLQRIIPLNDHPAVRFGSALVATPNYTYIYGTEDTPGAKYMHVARAQIGNFLGSWEYWDGTGWTTDTLQSTRIHTGVSSDYSVLRHGDRYVLITQRDGFSPQIVRYEADQPTGPWKNETLLYCTPESGGNLFTYNALAHPEFTGARGLLISYNVNSFEFIDIFTNADNYRPRFIRVPWPD
jgi:hypothetical protein